MKIDLWSGGSERLPQGTQQHLEYPPVYLKNLLDLPPEKRPIYVIGESGRQLPVSQRRILDRLTHAIDPNEEVKSSDTLIQPWRLQHVLIQKAKWDFYNKNHAKFENINVIFDHLNNQPNFNEVWWRFYDWISAAERVKKLSKEHKDLRDAEKTRVNTTVDKIKLARDVEMTRPMTIGFLGLSTEDVKFFEDETHMSRGSLSGKQVAFLDKMTEIVMKRLPSHYHPKNIEKKKQPAKLQSLLFLNNQKQADGFFWGKSWERLKLFLDYQNFFDSVGDPENLDKRGLTVKEQEFFLQRPPLMMGRIKKGGASEKFLDAMTNKLRNSRYWPKNAFEPLGNTPDGSPAYFGSLEQPQKLQYLIFPDKKDKKKITGVFGPESWNALEAALKDIYPFTRVPARSVKLADGWTTEEVRLLIRDLEKKSRNASVLEKERIRQKKIVLKKLIAADIALSKELTITFGNDGKVDYVTYYKDVLMPSDTFGFWTKLKNSLSANDDNEGGGDESGFVLGVLYQTELERLRKVFF